MHGVSEYACVTRVRMVEGSHGVKTVAGKTSATMGSWNEHAAPVEAQISARMVGEKPCVGIAAGVRCVHTADRYSIVESAEAQPIALIIG